MTVDTPHTGRNPPAILFPEADRDRVAPYTQMRPYERPHLTCPWRRLVAIAALWLAGPGTAGAADPPPRLLVGNTETGSIVAFDLDSGAFAGTFVAGDPAAVPDDLTPAPGGRLLVSVGANTPGRHAGVRTYALASGREVAPRLTAPGLIRPYGVAEYGDGTVVVADFRSDTLLEFSPHAGDAVRTLVAGDGTPGGLAGPNDVAMMADGRLWVTTQGSVALRDGTGEVEFRHDSRLLAIDPRDGTIAPLVVPRATGGASFVSLLGIATAADGQRVFVSDFAGSVLELTPDGRVVARYEVTGATELRLGNLTVFDHTLYVAGFEADSHDGFVLAVPLEDLEPPGHSLHFAPRIRDRAVLRRPVGIAVARVADRALVRASDVGLSGVTR